MKLDLQLNDLKDIIREMQAVSTLATAEYEKSGAEPLKVIFEHLTNTVKATEPFYFEAV